MLPEGFEWRETQGHHQLWHGSRCVAVLQPGGALVHVRLLWREHWKPIDGRASSVAQAKRYVERWIAARVGEV